MAVFQHEHKKVYSIFKKSFIMETSMLPLSFDEVNLKNFGTMKVNNK